MKKIFFCCLLLTSCVLLSSCVSSHTVLSQYTTVPVSSYKYVVFGEDQDKTANSLDGVIMEAQSDISSFLVPVSRAQAYELVENKGEFVLSPKIHVQTQYWDGGHTIITVDLIDWHTGRSVALLKGTGCGFSILHDQNLALGSIRKQLRKLFGK